MTDQQPQSVGCLRKRLAEVLATDARELSPESDATLAAVLGEEG